METRGKLVDVSKNILSGKWRLTFEADTLPDVDKISGKDLRIKAVQWKERRSLNSNAYFHVLVSKIAEAVGASTVETKNRLLSDWGQFETNEDGTLQKVILRDDIEWEKLEWMHLHPTTKTRVLDDKRLYRVYIVVRGSHSYDTGAMSHLIDGTVQEAKALGIETLTPSQLLAMNQAWRPQDVG